MVSSKRQALIQRRRAYKKTDATNRVLKLWLQENETNANLEHIIQALENSQKEIKSLSDRLEIVLKFTHKAVQENQAWAWRGQIEQILQELQDIKKSPPAQLYICKFNCVAVFQTHNKEAEAILCKAVELSKDKIEEATCYLGLARYYDSISEYTKIKKMLTKCERLCAESDSGKLFADILLEQGRYHLQMYNLKVAQQYFIKSKELLEELDFDEDLKIIKMRSACLHYLGRISFERCDFPASARYYIKAQKLIDDTVRTHNAIQDVGTKAFYHLRLGQTLEACQILHSAKYHYLTSRNIFLDSTVSSTGLAQVELSLANLIGENPGLETSLRSSFKEQESQLKEALDLASSNGYQRGHSLALLKLVWFYIRKSRFHLVVLMAPKILSSREIWNSGQIKRIIILGYKSSFGLYGLGLYHRFVLRYLRWTGNNKFLLECPCTDPGCKKVSNTHSRATN